MRSVLLALAVVLTAVSTARASDFEDLFASPFESLCAVEIVAPAENLAENLAAIDPPPLPEYAPEFASVWTWPGMTTESLRRHLAEENHGLDPAKLDLLSHEQLVALHNSDHEGLLDRVRFRTSRIVATASRGFTGSTSCPSGNCPTGSALRAFNGRLFTGRFRLRR